LRQAATGSGERVGRKCPHNEAEAAVVPSARSDQPQVLVVQVEEACELLPRRFARVAAVGAPLVLGEEAYGHLRSFPSRA
jgi:hypothetical protein